MAILIALAALALIGYITYRYVRWELRNPDYPAESREDYQRRMDQEIRRSRH